MLIEDELLENWKGHRYYPISQFYNETFGEKVYKISVSVAETCPNRGGDGSKACIFCDEWGSAAYHQERELPLIEQVRVNRDKIAKRYKANKFLVYFQAYTNTFDRISRLRARFEEAIAEDKIAGIVLGTRPDCLPSGIFPLLKEISENHFVSVELGLQSFYDHHLKFLRRGNTNQQAEEAIYKLKERCPKVDLGIHLIFGLPNETEEEIIETAHKVNSLPIDNVKLHNLHVLTKTPLEELYHQGSFIPLELEEYAERAILFLRHLSPKIPVHRLAAVANRWDELIAPEWTKERMRPVQFIDNLMKERRLYQGIDFRK